MPTLFQNTGLFKRAKATFPVRHLKFNFSTSTRYWFNNDPYPTHLMNAMSSVFPRGELMLIEALRKLRPSIQDPTLLEQISAFIGQEAIHAREHIAFNRYAEEQAIDLTTLENQVDALYTQMKKWLPNMHIMAVGCAIEHITATLGSELLRSTHWNQKMQGPVGQLWLWHALEETEHKAVFFDAYQAAGGGYLLRALYMALAGSSVALLIGNGWLRLLHKDQQLNAQGIVEFAREFAGPGGLLNGRTVRGLFDYFRPSFHPNDHDTAQLEQQWRDELQLSPA